MEIQVLLDKLSAPLLEKYVSMRDLDEDVERLHLGCAALMDVVDDAEERQWVDPNVREWLAMVKDVVFDVNNILDEFQTEQERLRLRRRVGGADDEVKIGKRLLKKACAFFLHPSAHLCFRVKMAHRVRDVADRLESIAKKRSRLDLIQAPKMSERLRSPRESDSTVDASEVVGRDRDREILVRMLLDDTEEEGASVIPIVGMGGIGKTVLAQLVFNDERVIENFNLTMWVYVGERFDAAEIAAAIVDLEAKLDDKSSLVLPKSRLQNILRSKKYLLVLDDVWNEDRNRWSELEALLEFSGRGSKLLVTTRSERVASVVCSSPAYRLRELSDDDCWSLFARCAFSTGDKYTYTHPELAKIGKEIVKRCGGVPSAVKALGDLLWCNKSEIEWLQVRDNPTWMVLSEGHDHIMSTLRLSYDCLLSPLKSCFKYCSLFPNGFEFEKDKMIQLWIAEGFITASREGELMEDVGEAYLDELCQRSLFQCHPAPRSIGGDRIATFNIHNLIHDLVRAVAGSESLLVEVGETHSIAKGTRRLSFSAYHKTSLDPVFFQHPKLETVILLNDGLSRNIQVPDQVFNLPYLRVLDLSNSDLKTLPHSIGKQKHLRYLDLSNTDIEMLPKSITSLRNLQTLRLLNCEHLRELPIDLRKMLSLRHLEINCHGKISAMPPNLGELVHLKTLPLFVVGRKTGCGIEELARLDLRGALTIRGLQYVLDPAEATKAGFRYKTKLHSLYLSWADDDDLTIGTEATHKRVFEALQPHQIMKLLGIENYMGSKFPSWLMYLSISNLVIKNCDGVENLMKGLKSLPYLIFLTIEECRCLKVLSGELLCGLSSLQGLHVRCCKNLEKLDGLHYLSSLEDLCISQCPNLVSLPNFTDNLKTLKVLTLKGLPKFESLPELGALSSLEELNIELCRNVTALPS